MELVYSTGGREKYYNAIKVGDCACRAIANGTGMDYKEVYDLINSYAERERVSKRKKTKSNARNGVHKETVYKLLTDLGWKWVPTMFIGKGCQVHLNEKELPTGTLIVSVSKHLICVKDRKLYDTYDCTRNGTRCVYGYYIKEVNMKSLKTGFNELDKLINGLNGGDLIGIAARRGMCKTSFGINLINNVSKQTNKRILYFNLDSLKENNLSKKIINNNVEVIDDVSLIEDIKNKCEEANKQDISLVVIDYLQLITNNKKYKSKLAKTLDELPILKVLALELNIPIIIISRLSKIIDKREYKKPTLSDARAVGIIQACDKIIYLYSDDYYNDEPIKELELIVAKNRGGSLGTIKIEFNLENGLMTEHK